MHPSKVFVHRIRCADKERIKRRRTLKLESKFVVVHKRYNNLNEQQATEQQHLLLIALYKFTFSVCLYGEEERADLFVCFIYIHIHIYISLICCNNGITQSFDIFLIITIKRTVSIYTGNSFSENRNFLCYCYSKWAMYIILFHLWRPRLSTCFHKYLYSDNDLSLSLSRAHFRSLSLSLSFFLSVTGRMIYASTFILHEINLSSLSCGIRIYNDTRRDHASSHNR